MEKHKYSDHPLFSHYYNSLTKDVLRYTTEFESYISFWNVFSPSRRVAGLLKVSRRFGNGDFRDVSEQETNYYTKIKINPENVSQYIDSSGSIYTVRTGNSNDIVAYTRNEIFETSLFQLSPGTDFKFVGTGGGDDFIITGHGSSEIFSGTGNDFIDAGRGGDTIDAGSGDDIIFTGPKDKGIGRSSDRVTLGYGMDLVVSGGLTAVPGTDKSNWVNDLIDNKGDQVAMAAITAAKAALDIAGAVSDFSPKAKVLKVLLGLAMDGSVKGVFGFGKSSKPTEGVEFSNTTLIKDFNFHDGDVVLQKYLVSRGFTATIDLVRADNSIVLSDGGGNHLLKIFADPRMVNKVYNELIYQDAPFTFDKNYIEFSLQSQAIDLGTYVEKHNGRVYLGSVSDLGKRHSATDSLDRIDSAVASTMSKLNRADAKQLENTFQSIKETGGDLTEGETQFMFGSRGGILLEMNSGLQNGFNVGTGTKHGDVIYVKNSTSLGQVQKQVLSSNDLSYVLAFEGDDYIFGSEGRDFLFGGRGDDYLSGSAGNDYLYGGEGNNTFYGGSGADTFVFNKDHSNYSTQTIKDFEFEVDKIDISGFGKYSERVDHDVWYLSGKGVIVGVWDRSSQSSMGIILSNGTPEDANNTDYII